MKINRDLYENNVKAENQVKINQHFLGKNLEDPYKVMFIGNSITYHETKNDIGWPYRHGMAASKPQKDYVHLLRKMISKKVRKPVSCLVYNASDFERDFLNHVPREKLEKQAKKFNPNLIIVRLGENLCSKPFKTDDLEREFLKLVKNLKKITNDIQITSLWWGREDFDNTIKTVAKKEKIVFSYIGFLGEKNENKAINKFKHQGVQKHPGDLGMKRLADILFNDLNKYKLI